jgi:NDP-sugar pyrophosphorylase family protein
MVLAAGEGRRLRSHTTLPKPMVSVNGQPVISWTLDALARNGVRDVVINVHYRPDVIPGFCGDGARWNLHIQYSPESTLQGTAGALRPWQTFFDDTFLLVYGDNLTTCDYSRLIEVHRRRGADATVALFWREDPFQSGIAELDDEGWIRRFLEKPSPDQVFSHWVNAGVLVLEPDLIAGIPSDGTPDVSRDLLPRWLQDGRRVLGYRMSPTERLWWIDTPTDLLRVEAELQQSGIQQ